MDFTRDELFDIYSALDSAWMELMRPGNNWGSVYEKPSEKIARLDKLISRILAEDVKQKEQDGQS